MIHTPSTRPQVAPRGSRAKSMGAYYTQTSVAHFLSHWAIRHPQDTVMDPSFGGGVFLEAASERLAALEGTPARQVYGVEVDPRVHHPIAQHLHQVWGLRQEQLIRDDFFAIAPKLRLDAVIGNPPFIRYQRFTGASRALALKHASALGVSLSKLCSSWAPFLLKSAAQLCRGGRLAMVIPLEIAHAGYALPVLRYLKDHFATLLFLTFQSRLFPDLSEDTLLLLGEDFGGQHRGMSWLELEDATALDALTPTSPLWSRATPLNSEAIATGTERLIEYRLEPTARALYHRLCTGPKTVRLGHIADTGIGYVTGNNRYFHLSPTQIAQWKIEAQFLRPAVRRGKGLKGLTYTDKDWEEGLPNGQAGQLLCIPPDGSPSSALQAYLTWGEEEQVQRAFKCRIRTPWYAVPHVRIPDAFLTYMSGESPRIVVNEARVVATNSLHILRLHPESALSVAGLAVAWQTSLTQLSAELEGHAMGGGMLKLEPGEASRVFLPLWQGEIHGIRRALHAMDQLVRGGDVAGAQACADRLILEEQLGLSPLEIAQLSEACATLRTWRRRKPGKSSKPAQT